MRKRNWSAVHRLCVATALALITGCGMLAMSAPGASASTAVASPRPETLQNCLDTLTNFGYYPQTVPQQIACGVAAKTPYSFVGAGLCAAALKVTGVSYTVSGLACTAGTAQGFTHEQWCEYTSGTACLNAWSGGPFVNAYTGGPETRDSNQDFTVIHNDATDDEEIQFIGSGSWSDDCLGDAYNNSGDADVSLDPCGTSSSGAGWGTNLAYGTNGCPSGEVYFFDSHWGGYLGPAGGFVNGSHFYLNKPTPYCFSVTFEP